EGKRQRHYLPPSAEQEKAADVPRPDDVPEAELPQQALGFRVQGYGMRTWADLFTNRQLVALTTFTDLVRETRDRVAVDSAEPVYANAITTYLGLCASKAAAFHTSQARWRPNESKTAPAFGRQALPMVWDFAETNPFAGAGGDWTGIVDGSCKAIQSLPAHPPAHVSQQDAMEGTHEDGLIAT